jgi:hypothetical protein
MGGGVQDYVGMIAREDSSHSIFISNISHYDFYRELRPGLTQLAFDLEESKFRPLYDQERCGLEACNLARKFRTD